MKSQKFHHAANDFGEENLNERERGEAREIPSATTAAEKFNFHVSSLWTCRFYVKKIFFRCYSMATAIIYLHASCQSEAV